MADDKHPWVPEEGPDADDEFDVLGESEDAAEEEQLEELEGEEVVAVDEPHEVEDSAEDGELSAEDLRILDDAERDLVAEYRDRAARAEADLVNFRNRVERDRQLNREATIAEVLRTILPALDDLDRAEAHGDMAEGTPMAIIAAKLRTSLSRFGLSPFGEKGEPFDPTLHEALFQLPTPGAESETIADVVEVGYRFGERVVRPAKVAVAVPAPAED